MVLQPLSDLPQSTYNVVVSETSYGKQAYHLSSQDCKDIDNLFLPSYDYKDSISIYELPLQYFKDSITIDELPLQYFKDSAAIYKLPLQYFKDSAAIDELPLQMRKDKSQEYLLLLIGCKRLASTGQPEPVYIVMELRHPYI